MHREQFRIEVRYSLQRSSVGADAGWVAKKILQVPRGGTIFRAMQRETIADSII
jgi:hypothetical protein